MEDEEDVIAEITTALDNGVRHVRIGGATDIYTYKAEGDGTRIPHSRPRTNFQSSAWFTAR